MEVELLKLRKDLISAMDKANIAKEKARVLSDDLRAEKQLTLKKDEAFQQTKEYNTVLYSQYYRGFELLQRYLVKHLADVDLENLYFEAVDKEMAMDKAAQATQATVVAPEGNVPEPTEADGGEAGI